MPKIPKPNIEICPFKKFKGQRWDEIVKEDPWYLDWFLSPDCPVTLTDEQYEYILEVREEHGDITPLDFGGRR